MKNIYVTKATGTEEHKGEYNERAVGKAAPEDIGKFWENNGVFGFVDEQKDIYVGMATMELKEQLEARGYREEAIYVPHTNDSGKFILEKFPGVLEKIAQHREARETAARMETTKLGDIGGLVTE
jgi:hypothetical protein